MGQHIVYDNSNININNVIQNLIRNQKSEETPMLIQLNEDFMADFEA